MGDVMLFGVLRMPYDMAMADEFTRYQYHQRGLQAADAIEALQAEAARLRKAISDIANWMDDPEGREHIGAVRGARSIARAADIRALKVENIPG